MLINPATNHDNTQNTSFENCPNHIVEHANISNYLLKIFSCKKINLCLSSISQGQIRAIYRIWLRNYGFKHFYNDFFIRIKADLLTIYNIFTIIFTFTHYEN